MDVSEETSVIWPTALYEKLLNPPPLEREQPAVSNHQSQICPQPPKLDWRTDRSYRKVMGVMGGLGWMEGSKANERSMLSFSPSDESHHVKHFKPLP